MAVEVELGVGLGVALLTEAHQLEELKTAALLYTLAVDTSDTI